MLASAGTAGGGRTRTVKHSKESFISIEKNVYGVSCKHVELFSY